MSVEDEYRHWARLSYLDVLRPKPGYSVTDVLLSTYSLDLSVLVSCLLAMTDRDQIDGGGSKVALAQAIDHFRPSGPNRLAVMVQAGRIAPPRNNVQILSLLDRFVREVKLDQREASWHAKAALVRLSPICSNASGACEWRLWIGSRNLTKDMSWDTGLVLVGSPGAGVGIKGASQLAGALLDKSGWEQKRRIRLRREFEQIRWSMPEGMIVSEIAWLDGRQNWKPSILAAPNDLVVITPFLDSKALEFLDAAGSKDCRKTLLTTQTELDRRMISSSSRLYDWKAFVLETSAQGDGHHREEGVDLQEESPEPLSADDAEAPIGLHAKIIAARSDSAVRVIMGSANVTRRAWQRNVEVVATLEGDSSIWAGIEAIVSLAGYADLGATQVTPQNTVADWLETFRNILCSMNLRQSIEGAYVSVEADCKPIEIFSSEELHRWNELGIAFYVAPLCASENDFQIWLPEVSRVSVGIKNSSMVGESELLEFRLVSSYVDDSGSYTQEKLGWVQHVSMSPRPSDERDKRIISSYLTARQYIHWFSGFIDGLENSQDPWSKRRNDSGPEKAGSSKVRSGGILSIESLLRAWQRDPECLSRLVETFDRYFDPSISDSEGDEDIVFLERFRQQLGQISQALRN